MRHTSKSSEKDYLTVTVPEIVQVPTLTTQDERDYLYWLVKEKYEGAGAVVEIGTWFGASAYYLAVGLRDSGKQGTLLCFDRFRITPGDIKHAAEQGHSYNFGSDSLPFVQEHLNNLYPHTRLIKTEINQMTWPVAGQSAIELLHLDAPKRWSDIVYAMQLLGPYLMVEKSMVIAQDFCLPRAYALPLIFYALRDVLELEQIPTEYSTMATFRVVKEIPSKLPVFESFTVAQAIEIINFWKEKCTHAEQKKLLTLSLAFVCYDKGEKELADELMQQATD
jgi:hypothetical protein